MKQHISLLSVLIYLGIGLGHHSAARAESFQEILPVYGVIKPGSITTLLAVNHGIVSKIHFGIGQRVSSGDSVIEIMEKETTRSYRTALKGGVAKLHVTQGAAVTPGMPLITILDAAAKQVEISLSPQEAQKVLPGASILHRKTGQTFARVLSVSPLVDPDTGAVVATVAPTGKVEHFIGDVIPLDIILRDIPDCKIVPLRDIDGYLDQYQVEAVSDQRACLRKKG